MAQFHSKADRYCRWLLCGDVTADLNIRCGKQECKVQKYQNGNCNRQTHCFTRDHWDILSVKFVHRSVAATTLFHSRAVISPMGRLNAFENVIAIDFNVVYTSVRCISPNLTCIYRQLATPFFPYILPKLEVC